MADMRRQLFAHIWEEEECLEYYGMVSLHQMFEVIGSQLTENDVEVLSFLLDETQPWTHPLDPALWTVAAAEEGGSELTSPALENWKRKNQCQCNLGRKDGNLEAVAEKWQPKNGVQLLLELERRGKCDETNFVQLLQLLRVLTRHDLLPYVTLKRQRTVSPERYTYGPSVLSADQQMDNCLNSASSEPRHDQWETGSNSSKRKRVSRGRSKATLCRRRGAKAASAPKQEIPAPTKVTCDIRLRVRAEYCQHEPVLRQNVMSNKQNHLERQFDVFGQSNTILKSRDLGSIICDIKFSELSYLDAFWSDYMNGSLLEALKGVFITDSLKEAVGQEAIRLLVNVDEDDYEEGRHLLLENFSPQALVLDSEIFTALLHRVCPKALQKHGVGPLMYMPEWFLCLFARTLPFPTVLRVWDAFLSEGIKVLFRVGLLLVHLALGSSEKLRGCSGLVETLEKLRSIPPQFLQEDSFMAEDTSFLLLDYLDFRGKKRL